MPCSTIYTNTLHQTVIIHKAISRPTVFRFLKPLELVRIGWTSKPVDKGLQPVVCIAHRLPPTWSQHEDVKFNSRLKASMRRRDELVWSERSC